MINGWLQDFKTAWVTKDINRVMDLFADDVEYWETPFKKLDDKNELRNEWQAIKTQDDIDLNLSVYSRESNRHTIVWNLSYTDTESIAQKWAGTYLVRLNDDGVCDFFYQTGERYE